MWNYNDAGTGVGTAMNLENTQGKINLFDSSNTGISISGGSVGIGTTSPAYKLDVAGFINTDQYSGYRMEGTCSLTPLLLTRARSSVSAPAVRTRRRARRRQGTLPSATRR